MPVVHAAGAGLGIGSALAVGEIIVRGPNELAPALAQHEKKVVIENQEIEKRFSRLAYWQHAQWWLIAALATYVFSAAIANRYKIDAEWHLKWSIERSLDGKITLTPTTPK